MWVSGCLAYYKGTETGGHKFKVRRRMRLFLGYPQGTKWYIIYDLNHRKLFVSIDVKFVEDSFPFAINKCHYNCNDNTEVLKFLEETDFEDMINHSNKTRETRQSEEDSILDQNQEFTNSGICIQVVRLKILRIQRP